MKFDGTRVLTDLTGAPFKIGNGAENVTAGWIAAHAICNPNPTGNVGGSDIVSRYKLAKKLIGNTPVELTGFEIDLIKVEVERVYSKLTPLFVAQIWMQLDGG